MKARRKKQSDMPQDTSPASPQWTQDAQIHFQQNGFYRATDLQRVLGDPGASVSSVATADAGVNNIWKRTA
jgi:hypothetical protein